MKRSHKIGLAPRGLTLIEIMIVVSIIAMVSAGVAVAAINARGKANLSQASTDARGVRNAVQTYWTMEMNSDCPTMSDLEAGRYVDEGSTHTDPWGHEWKIECEADSVRVTSAGPDGKHETEDDISVPKKREG